MLNKFLSVFIVLFLIISIASICYATGDVVMDLSIPGTSNKIIDNSTIGATNNINNEDINEDISVSTDYDVSSNSELSISNVINIILIVVGIVLILLGIAIILKLK